MADPYRYFRIEANEIVGQLEQGLLDLETRPNADLVARLLRLAHTFKGAARIVKHTALAELAHSLEGVLAPLRGTGVGSVDAAVALVAQMTAQVAGLGAPPVATARTTPSAAPASAPPRWDERRSASITAAPGAPDLDASAVPRVEPGMLDQLLGGLGELHARLSALRGARPDVLELDALDREVRGVRREAEQLRLLPASTIFSALERTARDASRASGKIVQFVSSGGETRVEARLLTALQAALVQLVRNAVAHGLESPAERRITDKLPAGRITIDVWLRGDRVVVQCDDDGRGIDLAAVREAAIARGFVDRATELDADQLIALLLRGGLSTSVEVTALAGRGIGLDVVRDAARTLGGEVLVRTQPGQGTAIAIEAPFSIASITALIVVAGGHPAAIPRAAIRRVVGVSASDLQAGRIALDDVRPPLAALVRVLGGASGRPAHAIVVHAGDVTAAVAVDHVIGFQDVVVRTLPTSMPVDPVVRGIAIDDAGRPVPVLDPVALIAAVARLPAEPAVVVAPRLPILVVDDSLTSRMMEQSILEAAGYEVDVAASAELAIVRATERAYALFLVDVEMPGIDGFAFVTQLRTHSQTPAILVTSRDAVADRRRGAEVGAQGYLIKGALDPQELLALVARLTA
jgi:two-component system chemotaxis sensor kinase CheA